MEINQWTFAAGMLLLRFTAGVLFFFQGYDKIFNIGLNNVVQTFADPMKKTLIPQALLKPLVLVSSYVEMLAGLLLALGLFREWALFALSADLAFVALSFSSMKAMWDMQFFYPRFTMVTALLLIPSSGDRFCVDRFF